ncbi:hypothetical protein C4559_01605 [Candidatus Microgenomates bacterium]|nr:MAG: hypothetical protein C4559_01605 [Candidatus Microgenomates bacterium]
MPDKEAYQNILNKRISRRSMLRGAAALGLGLALGGGIKPSLANEKNPQKPEEKTPVLDGILVESLVDDGETDNSLALQTAIDSCPAGQKLIIPESQKGYMVKTGVRLKSNIGILGENNNASFIAPPSPNIFTVFYGPKVENIEIGGLKIRSTEMPYPRSYDPAHYLGLTSNVRGFQISDSTNAYLHDVEGENLEYLFKLDSNVSSQDITINDIKTNNVHMPVFLGRTKRVRGARWDLGCPDADKTSIYDHQVYVAGDCEDVDVYDVICRKGAGYALQVVGYADQPINNISFRKVRMKDVGYGCVTCDYASNVLFNDVEIDGITHVAMGAIGNKPQDNIEFSNFKIKNASGTDPLFASYFTNGTLLIKNGSLEGPRDGRILVSSNSHNVVVDNITANNWNPSNSPLFFVNVGANLSSLTVKNSRFYYSEGARNSIMSLRGVNHADVYNNNFISSAPTSWAVLEGLNIGDLHAYNNEYANWARLFSVANTQFIDDGNNKDVTGKLHSVHLSPIVKNYQN